MLWTKTKRTDDEVTFTSDNGDRMVLPEVQWQIMGEPQVLDESDGAGFPERPETPDGIRIEEAGDNWAVARDDYGWLPGTFPTVADAVKAAQEFDPADL